MAADYARMRKGGLAHTDVGLRGALCKRKWHFGWREKLRARKMGKTETRKREKGKYKEDKEKIKEKRKKEK